MQSGRKQALLIFSAIFIFIASFWVLFIFIDINELFSKIGIEKGYLFVFLFALVGGVSAFTTASFFAFVAFLASQGLTPILLALSAAPALAIGDLLFYLLGKEGRAISEGGFKKFIDKLASWFEKKPRKFFPLFIYIYGLLPLPADILMITLGLLSYPFKKALPFIVLGHITFLTLLSMGAFAIFG